MIREAIILAGGLGTRLRSVIEALPKPMAPIGDQPFLAYLLHYLADQGLERIILSVGYQHEAILNHFGTEYMEMELVYAIEEEPLGTGGGIHLAMQKVRGEQAAMLNGDTFFKVDLHELEAFHAQKQAGISIALRRLRKFDRYGTVEIMGDGLVTNFREKAYREQGLINGGVYVISKDFWDNLDILGPKFSFEKDVLEKYLSQGKIYGEEFSDYFIDIGIPEDYEKAQVEIPGLFDQ